jgi:hypothetical protein
MEMEKTERILRGGERERKKKEGLILGFTSFDG